MSFALAELFEWMTQLALPFARIAGFIMVAPMFGARFVPAQIRIIVAVTLTVMLAGFIEVPDIALFSTRGLLAMLGEAAIGIAAGFVMTLIFDAVVLAAEFLSLGIGLGFAQIADPVRGVSTPVLGQLFNLIAILLFLAVDGHLLLIHLILHGFAQLPAGEWPEAAAFGELAKLGGWLFAGALSLALPALAAMLLTNLAYAVISRAAPALNMFAVGFPLSLLFGLFLLLATIGLMPTAMERLTGGAVDAVGVFLGGTDVR